MLSHVAYPIIGIAILAVAATIVVVRPYQPQYDMHNTLLLMTLLVNVTGFLASSLPYDWDEIGPSVGHILSGIASLVPIVYFLFTCG